MVIKTKEDLMIFTLKKYLDKSKIETLVHLNKQDMDLTQLSKSLKASMPLISYYINGNKKTEGLLQLGLVGLSYDDYGRPKAYKITELGKETLKILK